MTHRSWPFVGAAAAVLCTGLQVACVNGVVRWVDANVDFEDLQRAEDALGASERRLKLIIDTITSETHVKLRS